MLCCRTREATRRIPHGEADGALQRRVHPHHKRWCDRQGWEGHRMRPHFEPRRDDQPFADGRDVVDAANARSPAAAARADTTSRRQQVARPAWPGRSRPSRRRPAAADSSPPSSRSSTPSAAAARGASGGSASPSARPRPPRLHRDHPREGRRRPPAHPGHAAGHAVPVNIRNNAGFRTAARPRRDATGHFPPGGRARSRKR